MRYLLPCDCGQKIPVSTTQAGETLRCECGRTLVVPNLRDLRRLESAPDAAPPARPRLAWSQKQGLLFSAGGVLFLVAGLVLGVTWLQRQQLQTEPPQIVPEKLDEYVAEIDKNTPVQNLEMWQNALEEGLHRTEEPHFLIHRRVATMLWWVMLVSGVVCALGFGMIVSAFVLRPKSSSAATGRPRA